MLNIRESYSRTGKDLEMRGDVPSFSVFDNYRSGCLCGCQPYQSVDMPPGVVAKLKNTKRKIRDEKR